MGGGPPGFTRSFTSSVLLWNAYIVIVSSYRAVTFCGPAFQTGSNPTLTTMSAPATPSRSLVWAIPVSLAATHGIEVSFFSYGYLDVSVHRVRFDTLYIQVPMTVNDHGRVAPFGNPKIKARYQLPWAYRRLPRPSSPLDAKSSTRCS